MVAKLNHFALAQPGRNRLPCCRRVKQHTCGELLNNPKKLLPLRATLLCLLALGSLQMSPADDLSYPIKFLVEGYGGSESFSPRSSLMTSQSSRTFSARFNNSLWLVRFVGTSKDLDYVEIGTDGTNIFTLI